MYTSREEGNSIVIHNSNGVAIGEVYNFLKANELLKHLNSKDIDVTYRIVERGGRRKFFELESDSGQVLLTTRPLSLNPKIPTLSLETLQTFLDHLNQEKP